MPRTGSLCAQRLGADRASVATNTFAEHWNGSAWSIVLSQNPRTVKPGPNNSLIHFLNAVRAASGAVFASRVQGPDIEGESKKGRDTKRPRPAPERTILELGGVGRGLMVAGLLP